MQITSDPAQIAVGLNKNNYTNEMIQKSGKLTVSILSKTADMDLIANFGFQSSRTADKFATKQTSIGDRPAAGTLSGCAYQRCAFCESSKHYGLWNAYIVFV